MLWITGEQNTILPVLQLLIDDASRSLCDAVAAAEPPTSAEEPKTDALPIQQAPVAAAAEPAKTEAEPSVPAQAAATPGVLYKPTKPGDVAPPMPGRVVKVLVAEGTEVKTGDPLLIIEAMKMESQVPAPMDGRVTAILVAEGDNVKIDETVLQLE